MAKTSSVEKNNRRARMVKQYAGTADKMKLAGDDTIQSVECYVIESKSKKPPLKRLIELPGLDEGFPWGGVNCPAQVGDDR